MPTSASPQVDFACAVSVLSIWLAEQLGRPLVTSSPALSKSSEIVFAGEMWVPSVVFSLPSRVSATGAFSFFGKAVGEILPSKVASMFPALIVIPNALLATAAMTATAAAEMISALIRCLRIRLTFSPCPLLVKVDPEPDG